MKIDKKAALKSASWGMGQVMGFNAESIGYQDAAQMVEKFKHDEEEHLRASVEFIKVNRLDDELRALGDARTRSERIAAARAFARGYNGPAYAKNNYHIKLADAFEKWARIKDTPIPQETSAQPSAPTFDLFKFISEWVAKIFKKGE